MEDCLFCKIVRGEIPCLKVYEDDFVLAFLDIHPESNGHTLVVPKNHYQDIHDIDIVTLGMILSAAKIIMARLEETLHADGFRLIQNNGAAQDIKHFHLHICPYYQKEQELEEVETVLKKIQKEAI